MKTESPIQWKVRQVKEMVKGMWPLRQDRGWKIAIRQGLGFLKQMRYQKVRMELRSRRMED